MGRMSIETPVTLALDMMGLPYRFFQHDGPIHSLEQAAAERGQPTRAAVEEAGV